MIDWEYMYELTSETQLLSLIVHYDILLFSLTTSS